MTLTSSRANHFIIPQTATPANCHNPQYAAQQVNATLTSDLAAQLTAVEDDYGDSIDLGSVAHYWESPQDKYPADLNIVTVPVDTEPINTGDPTYIHKLQMAVIRQGAQSSASYSSTEYITIKLWRTVQAIIETVNMTTLNDTVGMCYVEGAAPTELFSDNSAGLSQAAILALTVHTS